jgi:para-aminobenzoate synthetase/4-amino-4-deoxychorismate lyase
MLSAPPQALVRATGPGRWLSFEGLQGVVLADEAAAVPGALDEVRRCLAEGLHAVGFLAYEAAAAFDPALVTHPRDPSLPVAWFGLFPPPVEIADDDLPPPTACHVGAWVPSEGTERYAERITRIREAIAAGTVYQVNYTLRLEAELEGDPWGLFRTLRRAQPAPFSAWLDIGDTAVCSVSPELFFELADGRLTTRPMKGTAPRGRTTAEDREIAAWLATSPKDRAENLMIVDMARNDLGRVAHAGSVEVERLFEVERYDSVFQMTSTVVARTTADFATVLGALFPAASITGAPKTSAMRIIRDLEAGPRGIYTGTIGHVRPDGSSRFNVAIRTVSVHRGTKRAIYGTGGGIVWDSRPEAEHHETRTKAMVLRPLPDFDLFETLLWEPEGGYFLLERHLGRLADSAAYFGRPCPLDLVAERLRAAPAGFAGPTRVRLLMSSDGRVHIEGVPMTTETGARPVALAARPVDPADRFLFHKTTRRTVYDRALEGAPATAEDVLLWNPAGELTESTIANVVVDVGDKRLTPPVHCGLLPGTYRAALLESGAIEEGTISLETLVRPDSRIWLISSLRRWVPGRLLAPETSATTRRRPE